MITNTRLLFRLLNASDSRRLIIAIVAITTLALLETTTIASILPFMMLMTQPEVVHENELVSAIYDTFQFNTAQDFLIFSGCVVLVLMIITNAVRLLTIWLTIRFTQFQVHDLSTRLLKHYLDQPYEFHIKRHSSDLLNKILPETKLLVSEVIVPMLQIAESSMLCFLLIALLAWVDHQLILYVAITLAGSYAVTYLLLVRRIDREGETRFKASEQLFKIASDAIGGIKEVKLFGKEEIYLNTFISPSKKLAKSISTSSLLAEIPRNLLEAIIFSCVILLLLYLVNTNSTWTDILPVLSLYLFAGYRLLPAMQKIFRCVTTMRFNSRSLVALAGELEEHRDAQQAGEPRQKVPSAASESTTGRSISLVDVGLCYPGRAPLFSNISLAIPAGSAVGLIGPTGSGKSSLLDLILGLIQPTSGRLQIDDEPLTKETIPDWQQHIGYVPQSIFLLDDSVTNNIAFGVPSEEIDIQALYRAANLSKISEMIETELPLGYETLIGERGLRLSGGQRQRLGIARALYRDPDVLILDEATSALDLATEREIIASLEQLHGLKTIIMVAHRLATVRNCDRIIVLNEGKITGDGRYEDLARTNPVFLNLAQSVVEQED
ncbi:MAG: ABC transporter ATP-binding protein [Woeseiaceae bacterium]|nr:ABC transporter ATP-binding protein [Woeseiaceae bacterium]